jgi:hypothetical protein
MLVVAWERSAAVHFHQRPSVVTTSVGLAERVMAVRVTDHGCRSTSACRLDVSAARWELRNGASI